jgi:hypothetical protein
MKPFCALLFSAVALLHSPSNRSLLSGFGWYLTVSSVAPPVTYFIRFYSSSKLINSSTARSF